MKELDEANEGDPGYVETQLFLHDYSLAEADLEEANREEQQGVANFPAYEDLIKMFSKKPTSG